MIAVIFEVQPHPDRKAAYLVRVADVVRDYGLLDREQAPDDSRLAHGA
jgi:hypothetical protein